MRRKFGFCAIRETEEIGERDFLFQLFDEPAVLACEQHGLPPEKQLLDSAALVRLGALGGLNL